MLNFGNGARASAGSITRANGKRGGTKRGLLLGSTALIGMGLTANSAMAQTATPAGGGTIVSTGGTITGGGAGEGVKVQQSGAGNVTVSNVNIANTGTIPTADGLRVVGPGGQGVGLSIAATSTITSQTGDAVYVQGGAGENVGFGVTAGQTLNVTGVNGLHITSNGGLFLADPGTAGAIVATARTANSGAGVLIATSGGFGGSLGSVTATNFATGIDLSGNGVGVTVEGGSITGANDGIKATSTANIILNSAATISGTNGIYATATNGAAVTTSGAGTINARYNAIGAAISAFSSSGTGAVTVNSGQVIGNTLAGYYGIDARTTGTSTGAIGITSTASIHATDRSISAVSAGGTTTVNASGALLTGNNGIFTTGANGTTITTSGGGTIDSEVAGTGTGINVTGSGATQITQGAAIGTTTTLNRGIAVSATGTGTANITSNAAITSSGANARGIVVTTAGGASTVATNAAISTPGNGVTVSTGAGVSTVTVGGAIAISGTSGSGVEAYQVGAASVINVNADITGGNRAVSAKGTVNVAAGVAVTTDVFAVDLSSTGTLNNRGSLTSNYRTVAFTGTLNNFAGATITSTGSRANGAAVFIQSSGTLINAGALTGTTMTDGVYSIAASTITNTGSITGVRAIYHNSGNNLTLNNTAGTITGSQDGVIVQGGGRLILTNTGTIQTAGGIGGGGASGVYLDSANGTAHSVTNSGTIVGGNYGVAIDTGALTLVNQSGGTITGGIDALLLSTTGAASVTLDQGSTVTGTILSEDSGARTLLVNGALAGNYVGGTGTGVVSFTLGATGAMQAATFGNANDTFTFQGGTIAGTVDAGTGSDALVSILGAGTGTLNQANLTGFESYEARSGTLTLTGTGNLGWSITGGRLIVNGAIVSAAGAIGAASGTQLDVGVGGVIDTTANGGVAIQGPTGGTFRIDNAGAIGNGTSGGNTIQAGATALTLNNSGTITTPNFVTVLGGANSLITNTGTITGGANSGGAGMGVQINGIGTVNNNSGGTITAAGNYGVRFEGAGQLNNALGATIVYSGNANRLGAAVSMGAGGTVANLGTIDMTGTAGQGVSLIAGGTINNGSAVNSTALIRANSGTGVLITGAAATTITNYGRITGGNGIAHVDGGAGALTVNNLGTASIIDAVSYTAIYAESGGLTLVNAGKVVGSSGVTSSGAATISNSGTIGTGTVSGGVFTLGGNGYGVSLAGGAITNTGTINSSAAGIYSSGLLALTNTGTIHSAATASGALDGVTLAAVPGTQTILNSGTISSDIYSGVVAYGSLSLTNAAAGQVLGGSSGSFGEGVQLGGAATINNYGIITGAATVSGINQGADAATVINLFAGSITGGILTHGGNDTLALYSGQINASAVTQSYADAVSGAAGSVTLQNAGTLAAAVFDAVDLGGGTDTLQLRGTGTGAQAGSFDISTSTGAEVLTKADAGTWTLTGGAITPAITINAGLGGTPGSGGLLIFDGTIGLSGAINVNGGTIRANTAGAFGTGTITAIDPTIQYAATGNYANPIVLASTNIVTDPTRLEVGDGLTATLTGRISESGTGQPLVFGLISGATAGTIVLANAAANNAWTGTTTIEAGTTLQGTTSQFSGSSIVDNGVLNYNQNFVGVENKAISGSGSLLVNGGAAGYVALFNAATFTGGTTIDAATLQIGDGGNAGSITGPIALLNNALVTFSRGDNYINASAISGNGRVRLIGTETLNGNITVSGDVSKEGAGTLTLGGTRSGGATSGVTVSGANANLIVADTGAIQGGQYLGVRLSGAGATLTNLGSVTNTGTGGDSAIGAGVGVFATSGINTIINGSASNSAALIQGQNAGIYHAVDAAGALVVENYGEVISATANGIENRSGAGALTVTNYGTGLIRGANYGSGISANGSPLSVANGLGGQIIGGQSGVYGGGATNSVENAGTISGTSFGIWFSDPGATNSVVNLVDGTISGDRGVDLSGLTTLINSGQITGGAGGAGVITRQGTGATVTNNLGATISGGSEAVDFFGVGGALTNDGTVSSAGTAVLFNGSGTGTVVNTGTITGGSIGIAAYFQGANITNTGSISGGTSAAITLNGSFDDIVNLNGGSVTGAVTLGDGNDTLNYRGGTFSSFIDGQGGNDAFVSDIGAGNSATLNLSDLRNFEGFTSLTGDLTTTGAGTATWTVASGTFTNLGAISTADGTEGILVSGPATVNNGDASNAGASITGGNSGINGNYAGDLTVNNYGHITGTNFEGVTKRGGGTLTLTNYGSGAIYGAGGAGSNAWGVGSDDGGTIILVNNAGGKIVGAGTAIRTSAAGTITNAGLIGVGSLDFNDGFTATPGGTAINLTGGTLTNLADGEIFGAVAIDGGDATILDLQAGSQLSGDVVSTGDGARTVTIAGTLAGAYNASAGSGVDTVTLAESGTLTSADLGDGDDIFNYLGGNLTGIVNGGAGTDSLFANFTAGNAYDVSLANFINFERFGFGTGNATITGPSQNLDADITSSNGGTVTFVDTETNTGDIYIDGGDIRAQTAGAFGTGTIHFIDPTAFYGATGTYANDLSLEVQTPASANPSTLSADAGVVATLTGQIYQGTGAGVDPAQPLTIDGAGTIVLTNAANAWAGTTTITTGSTLQGTTDSISGSNIANNGTLVYAQDSSGTAGLAISGNGALVKQGSGTVILAGNNSYTGGTSVQTGTLVSQNTGNGFGYGNVDIASGATAQFDNQTGGALFVAGGTNFTGAGTLVFTANDGAGTIIGGQGSVNIGMAQGGLIDVQSGTLVGSSNNQGSFTGNQASLNIAAGAIFNGVEGDIIVDALTGAGTALGGFYGQGGLTVGVADGSGTFDGTIGDNDTGAWNLSKVGTGTQTLTGTNGYTGQTVISGGTLALAGTGSIAGSFVQDDATFDIAGLTNGGTSVTGLGGAGSLVLGGNTLTLTGGGTSNFAGVASGTGGLTLQGGGTLILSGANSFTGTTSIESGTLRFGADNVLADTSTLNVLNGGTLDLNGHSDTVGTFNLTGTLTGGGTLTAANYNVYAGSTINQGIGGGALNIYGDTVLNSETSAAPVNIFAGTLTLGSAERLSDTGAVLIAAGGALTLGGAETIGSLGDLEGSGGTVDLAGSLLTVGGDNSNTIFSGVIANSGARPLLMFAGSWSVGDGPEWSDNPAVYTGQEAAALLFGGAASSYQISTVSADPSQINRLAFVDGWGDSQYLDNPTADNFSLDDGAPGYADPGGTGTSYSAYVNDHSSAGDPTYVNYAFRAGGPGVDINGLTKTGTGTQTLTGINSFTGLTTVDGGTLALGGGQAIADGNTILVNAGGTLALLADERIASLSGTGAVSLGSSTLILGTDNASSAFAGVASGSGGITQNGNGTLTLSGANTYTGTTRITGGTLAFGASNVLADASTLVLEDAIGDLGANSDTIAALVMTDSALNGTGTLTAATYALNTAAVNANLGTGTLANTGGVSTLNGTAAATTVAVNAGTLALGASDRLADNAALTLASGATLDLGAFNDTVGTAALSGTLAGTGTLTAATYALNGAAVNANLGAGTLTNTGGVSTLNGTAAAATVAVNAGTLALGASDRLADSAALTLASGATLDLGAFDDTVGTAALSGTLAGTGTLTAATYALSGAAVNANLGAGTLTTTGGVSVLTGTAAATTVAVNAGTLALGASDRLADNAALTLASGATLDLGAFNDTVGTAALSGTLAGTGTLTAATYALSGAAVNANLGTGTLTNTGGVSVLNGTAAATTVGVNAGTLALGASDRLADTTALTVASGATLNLGAFNDTVGTAALSGTLNGTGTLTAASYALNGAAVNANLGTGTLTNTGGVATLSGTAAATTVNVNAGTLRLGASERLANNATLSVASGASFDLAGFTETVGALGAGTGTLALGAGRLVLAGNADQSFAGAITGSGSLDKQGSGRLTLAGAYASTGRFDVSAGTLAFNGTSAGSLRVQGGTLIGQGSLGGNLTVASGSFAPGGLSTAQPIGSFQAQSLSVTGGSLLFDFGGANLGFASDTIRVTGPAVLAGGTVAVNALSATSQYAFQQNYTILQAGSLSGTFANGASFANVGNDAGLKWRLRYDLVANAVVLQVQKQLDFAAAVAGGSANQLGVGTALNGAAGLASDSWANTLNTIAALSPAQRGSAYDSLSGEAIADTSTSTIMANTLFLDLLRNRIGDGNDQLSGTGFAQSALGDVRVAATQGGSLASRLAAQDYGSAGGSGEGSTSGIWGQAYGGLQKLSGLSGQAGLETTAAGIATGAEGRIGDLKLGIAGGYTEVTGDVNARNSTLDGRLVQAGGYASYDDGAAFVNLAGNYYWGKFDTLRLLSLGNAVSSASGRFENEGYSVALTAGYRADLGNGLRAVAIASATQTHDRRDAFTERAAGGLGLAAAAAKRDVFSATGEVRLGQWIKTGSGSAMPYVSVGVRYNAGDLDTLGNMRFSGAPSGTGAFQVQGAKMASLLGTFGAGIDVKASERISLGVAVENAYADRVREGRASMRIRIGF